MGEGTAGAGGDSQMFLPWHGELVRLSDAVEIVDENLEITLEMS